MLSLDEHEKKLYIFVALSRGQRATESRKSSFDFQKKVVFCLQYVYTSTFIKQ